MTIDELTDRIVEWEDQRSPTHPSPDRRRVREELHDVDLPALDDRGVLEFNADEGIVGSRNVDHDPTEPPAADRSEPARGRRERSRFRPNDASLVFAVLTALAVVLLTAFVLGQAVAAVLSAGLVAFLILFTAAYRLMRGQESA